MLTLCAVEMVARAFKNVLRRAWRANATDSESYSALTVSHFNCLLLSSPEASQYWAAEIFPELSKMFPSDRLSLTIQGDVTRDQLFVRCQLATNVTFSVDANRTLGSAPLRQCDIVAIRPKVKCMAAWLEPGHGEPRYATGIEPTADYLSRASQSSNIPATQILDSKIIVHGLTGMIYSV